ncbi:MAG: DUF4159 domain-containing protein [Gemmatimonadota bacterium]
MSPQKAVLLVSCVLVLIAGALTAQQRGFGRNTEPMYTGIPEKRTGFSFCRLRYTSGRREAGGSGWGTDYPNADRNFMVRLQQLTYTPINRWSEQEPGFTVVRATEPAMYQCPFLFTSDVGTATFDIEEVQHLRNYLLKGGFLWVDDFWGDYAWDNWVGEIQRVLPEFSIVDLPLDHGLFSVFYQVPVIPQIPAISFWRRSGGGTSERAYESATPHIRAIFDQKGRILVLMSHNTDIADGWEREAEDEDFFYSFTGKGYGVGINVVLWALSH